MSEEIRQQWVSSARRVVVKVGSRVLTDAQGRLDVAQVEALAEGLAELRREGREVVLVSSGAVAAGMGELAIRQRPTDVSRLQAVAAVGQARLINLYNEVLRRAGTLAAQVLLTAADLDDRSRYLNVRNTLRALLATHVVPIVNENDSVAVEELVATFGDNDRLAALVTNLLQAPLLVILSDVPGLFNGDPAHPDSQLLSEVPEIGPRELSWVRDRQTGLSKGGMASKLAAAQMVTRVGESAVVASGREPRVLQRLFAGESLGTLFPARGRPVSSRKRWLGFSAQAKGRLVVDAGAVEAISRRGGSLLAIGVRQVEGAFCKGELVRVCGPEGHEVARGLINYDAADMQRIGGVQSGEIANVLGCVPYEEVIHRDNLLVTASDLFFSTNQPRQPESS